MDDHRPDTSVDRKEFLRRTGALGIAGAATLGFPLLETRVAGAAPLLPARDVIAAGGGATVKIGHIDGFSGVYAAASQSQQHGMEVAVDEAMKKNNRIKYEIVKGDDASAAATGTTEAKRLISQEKVDLLTGCLSSAVGLAVSATAQQNNTFFLAIGTHDTNITGPKAHRVTFRQTCSNAMLANAIGPALLKHGKKWYFLVADYAFGTDGAGAPPEDPARAGRPSRRRRPPQTRRDRLLVLSDQGAQHRRQRTVLLELWTRLSELYQGCRPARAPQEDGLRRDLVRQRRRGRHAGR